MNHMKEWLQRKMKEEKIPDSLSPEQMEKKLGQKKQKKKMVLYAPQLVAAACILLLLIGSMAAVIRGGNFSDTKDARIQLADNQNVSSDSTRKSAGEESDKKSVEEENAGSGVTYSVLYRSVRGYQNENGLQHRIIYRKAKENVVSNGITAEESVEDSMESASADAAGTSDHSETDMQVQGVDEGDKILTDGEYIYTLEQNENANVLHILKAAGNDTKETAKIKIDDGSFRNMYLDSTQNKLFIITWKFMEEREEQYAAEDRVVYDIGMVNGTTSIYVIDISRKDSPKEEKVLTQQGIYKNSRMTGGFLYLFTEYQVTDREKIKEENPSTYMPKADNKVISPDAVYKPSRENGNKYTILTSLEVSNPRAFFDVKALFGSGGYQNWYMSQANLYVSERVWEENRNRKKKNKDLSLYLDTEEKTRITKFHYEDGKISYQSTGKVNGSVDGSYAFHEYQGNLCVIYSSYSGAKQVNGLYVLDSSLQKIGKIGDLGVDESIYASYYIDHMAYFVTYRSTDPVFAVDIADGSHPKLCSELKLPGYSDYLHSFGENLMVGIGYQDESEGIAKISLFHVNEDKVLSEQKKVVLKNLGYTYIFDSDHREVFVDEERGLLGFCVETIRENQDDFESESSFRYLLYKKNGDDFVQVWNVKADEEDMYSGIRGIRIGEKFYVVTENGEVKAKKIEE